MNLQARRCVTELSGTACKSVDRVLFGTQTLRPDVGGGRRLKVKLTQAKADTSLVVPVIAHR